MWGKAPPPDDVVMVLRIIEEKVEAANRQIFFAVGKKNWL